ncbi:MAG TPA: hypothetical protein VMU66_09825, partial [Gaiellales bacterium]|nr:hypothetical protein [Gaiellales bacterium]
CKPQCYFLIEPTGPAVKKSGATTRPVEYMLLADLATAQKYRLELVSGQPWKTVAAAVQPLSAVSTQIRTTLLSQRQQSFFTARWAALRKAEDKLVTYAPAYKPAPLPSTTSSSTATS